MKVRKYDKVLVLLLAVLFVLGVGLSYALGMKNGVQKGYARGLHKGKVEILLDVAQYKFPLKYGVFEVSVDPACLMTSVKRCEKTPSNPSTCDACHTRIEETLVKEVK